MEKKSVMSKSKNYDTTTLRDQTKARLAAEKDLEERKEPKINLKNIKDWLGVQEDDNGAELDMFPPVNEDLGIQKQKKFKG